MTRTICRIFLIQFLVTVLFLCTVSYLAADTISWPVSVAVPTGMVGNMSSSPVSVAVPVGMEGQLAANPVSVSVPAGFEGAVMTKPVSVALPVSAADGSYMGRPATVAFQPEKSGDPDLVGLWHMDGDWGDSSGGNLHAIPYNGASFGSDRKVGTNSGTFNGSSYAAIGNLSGRFPSNTVTVQAWVKLNDTGNGAHKTIAGGTGSWADYEIGVVNNQFFAQVCAGTNINYAVTAGFTPVLGQWYHVAGTFDGSTVRLYVNGTLMNSMPAVWKQASSNVDFWIGGGYCCGSYRLNGLVDEVSLYKRALSAEEIAVHYAGAISDSAAPAPPQLNLVPSVVGTNTITLSGTRTPNTSIWANNKRVAAFENISSWQGSYGPLQPGANILHVTALDSSNRLSPPVTRDVFYDNIPPIIESSLPANGANTAKVVNGVTIILYDANAGVDLAGSTENATVRNAAGQQVVGTWTTSGTKTIVFTPSNPFPQDTYTVAISPVDAVGNRTAQAQQIVFSNHDISEPITTISLSGTKDGAGWFSTPVTATLSADDGVEGAGVEKIEYSLDAGLTWQPYTAPFTFDQDGRTTVQFRAADRAGNVENPANSREIKINKTGLVGVWKMDGDWKDSSIIKNDGLPYGGVSLSPSAKMGINSASFDGSNDGIKINDIPEYQAIKNISVEAWIKPQRITSGVRQSIVSFKEGDTPNVGAVLALPEDATNKLRFWVKVNDSWQAVTSTQSITPNAEWYHVVGTYDGSVIKVYLNGVVTATIASGEMTNAPGSATSTVTIGARASNNGNWFQGLIDEVAIYNRALPETEIVEHYRNYSIGIPTVETVATPTNVETVTLRGTKPADTAIVVSGTTVSQPDASTTWEGSYTLKPGMNNLSVTAMDADGFHSQPVSFSVALDLSAPEVTATKPADGGIFNNDITSLSFTVTDAFSAIDDAATLAGAVVKSASGFDVVGAWSFTGSGTSRTFVFAPTFPMSEGSYTAEINPTDAFGNRNALAATLSFTVDATPPAAPTIDALSAPIRFTSKTVTGTKSADTSRVLVTCPGASVGAVSYPTATSWSVAITNLKEGSNSIAAYAEDAAGNPSDNITSVITVDLTPPAKPIVATFASPTKETTVTLTGSKEQNTWLFVNNQQIDAPFSGTSWSRSVSLGEGSNAFTLFAKDEAGNQGQSTSVTVVRDTTAPFIAASLPVKNSVTASAESVSVTFSDAAAGVDLQGSAAGAVVKNAADAVIAGNWQVSGAALIFTPTTQLPEGLYNVTLYPVDALGNRGSTPFSFTLDQAPPTVQSVAMSPNSLVKAGTVSFTLVFSEPMNIGVQPTVTVTRPGLILDTTYTLTGSWQNAGAWQGNYAFTADSGDAVYSVKAGGAKDVAGNGMALQTVGSFVLDTTAPAAPTVAPVTTPTKTATQTLVGTKLADTAIVINGAVRLPLSAAANWSYSYPLAEGTNALTIVARDAAGNNSPAIAPAPAIVLDTTPPLFTIDSYQHPSTTATQTISGKKEAGCVVKLNGTTILDAADQNATWSYLLTLTEGLTNHLVFTAADGLGNTTAKTIDILYDLASPTALGAGMLVANGSGKGTEVALSWPSYVEPADLAYYRVYYAPADFTTISALTPVGTVNKGTRAFKVSGLTQGTSYFFAVVPVDASGNFDAAVRTASAAPADTVAPEEVAGLAAWAGYTAADGNYVTLSWSPSANSTGDLADQVLYVDAGQGYDSGTPIGKTATAFTKKGLADATSYKFKVTVKDVSGRESSGSVATAVTRLVNPTGLAAVPGNQKATLTWNPVSSPYVKMYNIYRLQSGAQQTDVFTMTLVKSQAGTSFTDTGLTNGASYQYAVTALNVSGAERTDAQSIIAAPRGDTTGPVLSGVNLSANQVITALITITASATDAESSMGRIEIHIDGALAAGQSGGTGSYPWNVVNSTDGNHTVKIVAYDAQGNLTEQNVAVVVSLAPPATPVITSTFAGAINQKSVTITGTIQPGSTISLRVNGAVVAQHVATASTFNFIDVLLAEGDNLVCAKAGNRGGDSPFSADLKISVVTTAPAAPINLAARSLAGGSIQFTWQAGALGAPVGYNLYEVPASFISLAAPGVKKTNSTLISSLFKEYIPSDDSTRTYVVTAVDGAGNESPASNTMTIASDRTAPTAIAASFSNATGVTPSDNVFGSGTVNIALTVSEALSEPPFFSLQPNNASPNVVALLKVDDTHYAGSVAIDATSPTGPTVWKFSGKDVVANRGNGQGTGPIFDVKGPVATITMPEALLKTTAGAATVSLLFDESSTTVPSLILKSSDGSTVQVVGLATTDSGLHWSGTLDPTALAEGTAQFLIAGATDRFDNIGMTVKGGASILLYKNLPPSAAVPTDLAARSGKGGSIALTWTKVADAQGYNLYRRESAEALPTLVTAIASAQTVNYVDTPDADGSYVYSVSSLGLLNVESAQGSPVTAVSDRTPPAAPTGLGLTMTGNGVEANWGAVTPPAEVPTAYRIYRASASFTELAGLTPVATAAINSATDPSPATSQRFYAVIALDGLGNESLPSPVEEITFPVAPVATLGLTLVDDGKPSLAWSSGEPNVQGFNIYRNGAKINNTPTTSASYSDGYYAGGTVTYGVSVVDANGTESPTKEVTLPALSIVLKDGTTMHRGLLENITLIATRPGVEYGNLSIDAVAVKIGKLPESIESGPFTVVPGMPLQIHKVAATDATAPSQEAVVITAIMKPAPGTTVKITRSSLASVLSSGAALEVFNDALMLGSEARIRLKVNNLGSAPMEFLTSENGSSSTQVKAFLKDQDGNILGQGNLNQRTGAVVNSGSYAVARLESGESFLSDPIRFVVPSSAPPQVFLEVVIDSTYFHYSLDSQVVAPGMRQYVNAVIADVPYRASATTDKFIYKQEEPVLITGQATSTVTGLPMPSVPVKIGISVNGFDRFFTVDTDLGGTFRYTFTPGASEAGGFSVWSSYPELTDRMVQSQFSILGLTTTPALVNVRMLKGQSIEVPITLSNVGGGKLTGLSFSPLSSSGITANIVNSGEDTLGAGEKRTISLRLVAAADAAEVSSASLLISSAEGISSRVDATISLVNPIPLISAKPSYIDTGLVIGNQRIESFAITNSGYETLKKAHVEGPSIPWLSLTTDRNLGDIPAGQTTNVSVLINPPATLVQGVYFDRLVIYADNHPPYTYEIAVTVTSNAVGSVQFSLLNELMKQVAGASITIFNQNVPDLLYTLTTTADGTISLTDIPEGRYSYSVSAPGHKSYNGSFVVTPGIWTNVPVSLEVNLVQIEWSVTPTTIEDQYQINIKQTFETNVPTPVLITEPPNINLPEMQPGQVFNGELTITNYGLIDVYDFKLNFPRSFGDYDIEMLASTVPDKLRAMQKIIIPFRITRRISVASANTQAQDEVNCYGGSQCQITVSGTSTGKCVICPKTLMERIVDKISSFTFSFQKPCDENTPAPDQPGAVNIVGQVTQVLEQTKYVRDQAKCANDLRKCMDDTFWFNVIARGVCTYKYSKCMQDAYFDAIDCATGEN